MTPLGHATIGYWSGRCTCLPVSAALLGGVWPDLDFLLVPLLGYDAAHRTFSHSLLFIALSTIVIGWIFRHLQRATFSAAATAFFLGGALHCLVDSTMDNYPANGIGVLLLWPFSDAYFSPFNFFPAEQHPIESKWGYLYTLRWVFACEALLAASVVLDVWNKKRAATFQLDLGFLADPSSARQVRFKNRLFSTVESMLRSMRNSPSLRLRFSSGTRLTCPISKYPRLPK